MLERFDTAFAEHLVATANAGAVFGPNVALGDEAAGDFGTTADDEDLADFGGAADIFLNEGFEQAGHAVAHFVDQFIDDLVEAYFDTFMLGGGVDAGLFAHMEGEDDGI